MSDQRQYLRSHAQSQIIRANEKLAKFAKDMAKDPVGALAWADATFESAGKSRRYTELLGMLDKGTDLKFIEQHFHDVAMRYSRMPSRSTSACSNLMEQFDAFAAADVYDTVHGVLAGENF